MAAETKAFSLGARAIAGAPGARAGRTAPDASSRRRAVEAFISVLLVAAAVAGCSSSDKEVNTFLHEWETTVSSSDYHVQPPDTIEISSAQAAEIDGEEQTIRSDGKISLRLLGEVEVAGLTPVEIAQKLENLLRSFYVDPQVNVRVTGRFSKCFYVFGQVSRPGAFNYTGRDTLLYVLSQSQPTELAWTSQVKVIHPSHENERRFVMTVDVDRIIKQGKLEKNVLLQEGDIVYVPASPLAWVGLRMQELLFPLTPAVTVAQTPVNLGTSAEASVRGESYRLP